MAPTTAPPPAATTNIVDALASAITIKLDQENFLLWKAQALSALYINDLYGFVDGIERAPAKKVAASVGISNQVDNPNYAIWFKKDQKVLSGLLASLTPSVLGHVQLLKTLAQVWEVIVRMFASNSKARVVQLRAALVSPKKSDMMMANYFDSRTMEIDRSY
jgi:hypothetical protein